MPPLVNFKPTLFFFFALFAAVPLLCVSTQFKFLNARKNLESAQSKIFSSSLLVKTHNKLINKPTSSKLNSTSKSSNSSKPISFSTKKTTDLLKLTTPMNQTKTPNSSKQTRTQTQTQTQTHLDKLNKNQKTEKKQSKKKPKKQTQTKPNWIDEDEEEDLVSEFRNLPTKFQNTLAKISTTSKSYITKANKQMTMGFKPIVGKKHAATVASSISFTVIIIPLILVSVLFNRIQVYFSIRKLLLFIQFYLSIYFGILCLSSSATRIEPLKFLYFASQSTYVWVQVMQALVYILYLVVLVMYLVLVFSTDCGLGSRMLGLAQILVGYGVGLHYYVGVLHRMVLHQPPSMNWKIHGIYATCFLVICVFAGVERRKKAYLEEDGGEGKKS